MQDPRFLFRAAADVLTGDLVDREDGQWTAATRLLDGLGLAEGPQRLDSARLLRAAAGLDGFFRLPSPHAPGMTFFGGLITPRGIDDVALTDATTSISGAGLSPAEAFRACLGEGVEFVSQFARNDIVTCHGTFDDAADWNGVAHGAALRDWVDVDGPIDWVLAEHMAAPNAGRRGHWLPSCLALRSSGETGDRWAVGSGCAAGPDMAAARMRALLEVIERDAVAMWWRGGRAPRMITRRQRAALGIDDLLDRIRQHATGRTTTLYQLACEFGPVCIAAVSFDAGGGGFAGGYACHPDPLAACRSAIREMCQMELGNDIVARRLGDPDRPQSAADLEIRDRLTSIGPDAPQFRCEGDADLQQGGPGDAATVDAGQVADSLAEAGHDAFCIDLTMDHFGIAVAKAVVPGLQPYPSRYQSPRLSMSIATHGNSGHASLVDLL